jgi:hypothetical protein
MNILNNLSTLLEAIMIAWTIVVVIITIISIHPNNQ